LSQDDEIKKLLSYDNDKSETKWLCPVNYFNGYPYKLSYGDLYNAHVITL